MPANNREPDIVVVGYGVRDTLQLTVETQRVLTRVGKAYALNLPPKLARHLKSLRVQCVDLAERFSHGRRFSEIYLDIVDLILQRTAEERPVVFITPGNPLFLNTITRFLVQQARERDLAIVTYPGVSQLDDVLSYLGLDVTTFGLQLFDAQRLVARQCSINPGVPVLVLQLAGFAAGETLTAEPPAAEEYAPLAAYLSRFYAADQPVTLVNASSDGGGPTHFTRPLGRVSELVPHVRAESSLFIDRAAKTDADARQTETAQ